MANLPWLSLSGRTAATVAWRALAVLAVATLALPSCSRGGLSAGDAATLIAGEDVAVADGERWRPVHVGDRIAAGARVRAGAGEARLEFRTGEVWLAADTTAVVARERLELQSGDALVSSGGTLAAAWNDAEVGGEGVYRLTPGLSPRLAVYSGSVRVTRPAQAHTVDALFQVGLAATRLGDADAPLAYRATDQWDQRLLPRAIAFDDEITALGRGIDRQYGTAPQPAAFYRDFTAVEDGALPILAATARTRLPDATFGPPSDALLTLFVAQAGATAAELPLAQVAADVAGLRAAGARWGLVAEWLGIGTTDLARVADLGQARFVAQQPPAPVTAAVVDAPASQQDAAPPASTTTTAPAATAPAVTADTATTPPPAQEPAGDEPPSSSGTPPPPEPELPTGPGTIERTVAEVLDPVVGAADAIVDTVGGLID